MNGYSKKILQFLDGSDKQFIIPVYQRNYDWSKSNCERLYNDLIDIIKQDRKTHFFGSIVSINEISSSFNIIDGQQRLTTVSVLMIALYNLLKAGLIHSEDENLADKICETYLINKFSKDSKRMKLKPIKKDEEAFEKLFKPEEEHIKVSNLTVNYDYFYNRIQQEEITADELYEALTRLEIIDISLKHGEDDPQLIFESINSTGLDLQEADKIRNFILMDLDEETQNRFYYDYWNKIEENTDFQVSEFIRYYLIMRTKKVPSINNVYSVFKDFVGYPRNDLEPILKSMKEYSTLYHQIITASTNNYEVNLSLNRINKLEFTVTYPFFLHILGLNQGVDHEVAVSDQDTVFILNMIETYILRRMFCNYPTSSLVKIFATLHSDAINLNTVKDAKYPDRIAYVLENKEGTGTFPTDEQFIEAIKSKDVYKLQSKNRLYIFDKLENGNSKEHVVIYDNDSYSVEHIMPQTLSDDWRKDLGEHAEEIHEEWLHKLANLTLTAYNSSYSNKRFSEKKEIPNGFNQSGFKLNDFVRSCKKWSEEELETRQDILIDQCLTAWPYYDTDIELKGKEIQNRTLSDEDSFINTLPVSYQFKEKSISVNSWVNLELDFIKQLYEINSANLYKLIGNTYNDISKWFSSVEQPTFSKVHEGLYVKTGTNTDFKISLMCALCNLYSINPDDIQIELEEVSNDSEDGISYEEVKRFRKEFWTVLSNHLKTEGSFKNIRTANSGHTYDITIGTSGIYIRCGINRMEKRIIVKLVFTTHYDFYQQIKNNQYNIDKDSNYALTWRDLGEGRRKQIFTYIPHFELTNPDNYEEFVNEVMERIKYFASIYHQYVK